MPPRTPCPQCNTPEEVAAYNNGKRRMGLIKLRKLQAPMYNSTPMKTPVYWCNVCNYTEVQE